MSLHHTNRCRLHYNNKLPLFCPISGTPPATGLGHHFGPAVGHRRPERLA